jgi:hypothetical protein
VKTEINNHSIMIKDIRYCRVKCRIESQLTIIQIGIKKVVNNTKYIEIPSIPKAISLFNHPYFITY